MSEAAPESSHPEAHVSAPAEDASVAASIGEESAPPSADVVTYQAEQPEDLASPFPESQVQAVLSKVWNVPPDRRAMLASFRDAIEYDEEQYPALPARQPSRSQSQGAARATVFKVTDEGVYVPSHMDPATIVEGPGSRGYGLGLDSKRGESVGSSRPTPYRPSAKGKGKAPSGKVAPPTHDQPQHCMGSPYYDIDGGKAFWSNTSEVPDLKMFIKDNLDLFVNDGDGRLLL